MTGQEMTIDIEKVRIPTVRLDYGGLSKLATSIENDGLRHPITVWSDGTLISGARRLRAHYLLSGMPGKSRYRNIPAVFVDTLEDATKRLLGDNGDETCALPLKPSEICRLWGVLRKLDEPAAAHRLNDARRRGVELRRQTQTGQRTPGRSGHRGTASEYAMGLLGEPFGMAEATASRLWAIHTLAHNLALPDTDRRMKAQRALDDLDAGRSSVWASYSSLIMTRRPVATRPKAAPVTESAAAARQQAAWGRSLPQLEGLVAGLTELGPPHPDLDWNEVGPVRARLARIRRDLEKIIHSMKETAQS